MTQDDKFDEYLEDYKDFESDLESNQNDSFANNIDKIYEDHKKNTGINSEAQNVNRPVSSYQRVLSANSKKERPLSSHTNTNNNNTTTPDKIINRLTKHIKINNISENAFIQDNRDIYLDKEEFQKLFKAINFEIKDSEVTYLFNLNNPSASTGYIQGKFFLKNYEKELVFAEGDKSTLNLLYINESKKEEVKKNLLKKTKSLRI